MKTLIIYDNEGYPINTHQDGYPAPRLPVGVPYIYEEIPIGKKLVTSKVEGVTLPVVDVSVTPNKLILEDIPPTEVDVLRADLLATQQAVDFLLTGGV